MFFFFFFFFFTYFFTQKAGWCTKLAFRQGNKYLTKCKSKKTNVGVWAQGQGYKGHFLYEDRKKCKEGTAK